MRHDKLLFTPGPLSTSETVKQAMLRDLGSRDLEFLSLIENVRRQLSDADCFRIGTIGHIFPQDIKDLVAAVQRVLGEMQIDSGHSVNYA